MNNENKKNEKNMLGKVGFVGAGKVGFTLGRYFMENGIRISGYLSQHEESAKEAADFTNSRVYNDMEDFVKDSDTLFITVPDGRIKDVWDHMQALPLNLAGKSVCHASGSLTSDIFSGMDQKGIFGFSVHPLFAISDKYHSYQEIGKCLFTVEGKDCAARQHIVTALQSCGNNVEVIQKEQKPLYHAAAVVVSNFVVGLSYLGSQMLRECGFSKENAAKALLPILLGNGENIAKQGSVNALTGPVERNDVSTVVRHLQAFERLEKEHSKEGLDVSNMMHIYKDMTKLLTEIGQTKHQDYDYGLLKEVLLNEEYSSNISGNEK